MACKSLLAIVFPKPPTVGATEKLVKLPTLGATPISRSLSTERSSSWTLGAAMMNTTTVRLIPSEESPQPHRSKRNLPTYRVVVRRALAATASSPTGPWTAAPGASVSPYSHRYTSAVRSTCLRTWGYWSKRRKTVPSGEIPSNVAFNNILRSASL